MTTLDCQLTIHPVGGDTTTRRITAQPDTLAQEIHRHVRGLLGGNGLAIHLDGLTGAAWRGTAHVADFTLEPVTEPEAAPEPIIEPYAIRYGWTLHALDALTRAVVSNNFTWWPAGDRDDLYTAAWHGIVEHLYTADTEPHRNELMEAGRQALARDVKDTMRHHGARRDSSNNGQKYAMYWEWAGRAVPSPENGIVERLALYQILPTLTPGQLAAVKALAATGDYAEAARLIGRAASLKSQLMKGRRRFRELWHEGETPSRPWGCDRRAGSTAAELSSGDSALNRMRRRARAQKKAAA